MTDLRNCVLIVDDEAMIAELWRVYIDLMGLEVCGTAATADEAIAMAERHRPSLVLMDVRLQGNKDGVDAALAINASVGSKVIFITGSNEPETLARIQLDHPSAVLFKPVSHKQLHATVRQIFPTA